MTAVAVLTKPPAPAAGWTRGARWAAASTILAGGLLWVVAELITFGKDRTMLSLEHPTAMGVSLSADLLAVPFMFGTMVIWFLLSHRRAPRLAWIGVVAGAF